jgi:hypothetical protein
LPGYYLHPQRNEALPKKKLNMNTKMLLLGTIITTLASASFASDALLSPRAQGNQIKVAASVQTPAVTVIHVGSTATMAPRLQAAQIRVVKGIVNDRNPALECRRTMLGSPKAVIACSQSITMPGCMKLASAK